MSSGESAAAPYTSGMANPFEGVFTGKVAVVTGASSGIGRATALGIVAAGGSVLATGRDQGALDALGPEAGAGTARLRPFAADLVADDSPALIVNAAVERFGGLDVLVNAAGIIGMGTTDATTDEQWDRIMTVNLRAPFRLMREAFPHLKARRGAVVNVSSVNGQRVFPNLAAYNTSKGALDHLTRTAAIDWAPAGVRVNGINPGVTVTNLHRRSGMTEEAYAAFLERSRETHPLGRPGDANEVAALILFLASDLAGWITGDTVAIDGGRHLTCAR